MKNKRFYLARLFLLLLVFQAGTLAATPNPPAGVEDPQKLLQKTIDRLINKLEAQREQIKQDQSVAYRISDELIAPYIDFPRIARLVIGKHWRKATNTQKTKLVEEIRSLLTRSYVTAMTSYTDEIIAYKDRIQYQPSRYKPGDRKASVRATVGIGNGQTVEVQYQLYLKDGKWKIYDIRIEGISLALTYRTTFGETIRREGLDKLIAQLEERNRNGDVELPDAVAKPFRKPAPENSAAAHD
ncbi:MAG TPA: ABC transporter substrate-binding protein [Gammaproteobacteria bacterium]|nr:ABC transporter substrate-binding protein [Gammaproteobacteria bacterium]